MKTSRGMETYNNILQAAEQLFEEKALVKLQSMILFSVQALQRGLSISILILRKPWF